MLLQVSVRLVAVGCWSAIYSNCCWLLHVDLFHSVQKESIYQCCQPFKNDVVTFAKVMIMVLVVIKITAYEINKFRRDYRILSFALE